MGKIPVLILIVVILAVSGCNPRVGQEEKREELENISVGMNRQDIDNSLLTSIGTIFPEPNSSLPIDSFQQATNSPETPFVALEDSSICIEIWGNGLVVPGELDSTNQEIMERFSISINGDEYFKKPVIYTSDADGRTVLANSGTGDIEYFIPSGFPSILCYYILPVAGEYLIRMNYLSRSNQLLQHQWSFRLTED